MKKILFCGLAAFLGMSVTGHSSAPRTTSENQCDQLAAVRGKFPHIYANFLYSQNLINEIIKNKPPILAVLTIETQEEVKQAINTILAELSLQSQEGSASNPGCSTINTSVNVLKQVLGKIIRALRQWKEACSAEDWSRSKASREQRTEGMARPEDQFRAAPRPTSEEYLLLKATGLSSLFAMVKYNADLLETYRGMLVDQQTAERVSDKVQLEDSFRQQLEASQRMFKAMSSAGLKSEPIE
jgi:hypothetical protein